MAVRKEWSIKYRAAMLERNPAFQLQRMTESNDAIQCRMGDLGQTSYERGKLENALEALSLLRDHRLSRISSSSDPFLLLGLARLVGTRDE